MKTQSTESWSAIYSSCDVEHFLNLPETSSEDAERVTTLLVVVQMKWDKIENNSWYTGKSVLLLSLGWLWKTPRKTKLVSLLGQVSCSRICNNFPTESVAYGISSQLLAWNSNSSFSWFYLVFPALYPGNLFIICSQELPNQPSVFILSSTLEAGPHVTLFRMAPFLGLVLSFLSVKPNPTLLLLPN